MNELFRLLFPATIETLLMVGAAGFLAGFGGLVLGVLLALTATGRLYPAPVLHRVLSISVNFGRSIPFIILIVAIVPLTRLVAGTSIGTRAAIVPLVIGAIPYVARLVEAALLEVDQGVVDAVVVMGAHPWQIIIRAYLSEARSGLIRVATVMLVTLISYSAMAGTVGGGGLGDLAIRYGYQRFRPDVMLGTVVVLVLLVQLIQAVGDALAKRFDRR